jgi:hypothetical protein
VDDLALGYFPNFDGKDTVLLACSASGCFRLRRLLFTAAVSPVAVHDIANVSTTRPIQLYLSPEIFDDGYTWLISPESLYDFDYALAGLTNLGNGHENFVLAATKARLRISVNEYDTDWWMSN